ncbi:MAG TPA: RDD family protein [Alphaproteobacteria bacterium]|nr:RDD family protein [Alphaproteobacteria bacterium]
MADPKLPAISLAGLGGGDANPTFDPLLHPELYDGVALRRVLAFCLDLTVILVVLGIAWTAAIVLAFVSFGLIVLPMSLGSLAFVVLYDVLTIGGPAAATPGMRAAGLKVVSQTGGRPDNVQSLLMSALFWVISSWSILPLAVALLNPRWRCVHDFLSGTLVVRRLGA